jgi:hypothetical protein
MWSLLFVAFGLAADCDISSLEASLKEASPIGVPRAYVKLAKCDESAAKKQAKAALSRTLAGSDANEAVLVALNVGAEDDVRTWLKSIEPDQRSRTIKYLGMQCKDSKQVSDFFVVSHDLLGSDFWKERWHRGLTDCRNEDIQNLLTAALDDEHVGRNARARDKFFAFLEVYARNLGEASLPLLNELVAETKEPREQSLLLSIYADAANVGGIEGVNPDVATKAVVQITEMGPNLSPEVIDQARDTLTALGSADVASTFAKYRWPERAVNGMYNYQVAAQEFVTCKNEKKFATFHFGEMKEAGNLWPNQIDEALTEALTKAWELDALANKCKGTLSLKVSLIKDPLPGKVDPKEWLGRFKASFQEEAGNHKKSADTLHDPFELTLTE